MTDTVVYGPVPATPPVGTVVGTDELVIGSPPVTQQVQRVELVTTPDGVNGVVLEGTAANGLEVDVTRVNGSVAVTGIFWPVTQPASLDPAQVAIPIWGHGSTSSAAPGGATLAGVNARSTFPTIAGDGVMKPPLADLFGRLVTVPLAPRELTGDATLTLSNLTDTPLVAGTANEFHDLVEVVCSNASPTVDTRVDFKDNGAVRFSLFVPAKATVGFTMPIPTRQAVVNTAWSAQCATTGADVRVFAQYVRNHN